MNTSEAPPRRGIDGAAAVWEAVMTQVPTAFGKLLWVASFRVPGTSRYWHPALDQMFSPFVASQVLQESHQRHFQTWLEMGLQEQHDDFVQYANTLRFVVYPKDFLKNVGDKLMPPSAAEPQRLLFDTDLAVVLELLD